MISSVLALALAAAAPGPSPDALARARKAYSACLGGYLKKSLKDGAKSADFESGLPAACTAQEQAFRAASIAIDSAAGIKRAAAEENAGLEVDDMIANTKETYTVNSTPAAAPK